MENIRPASAADVSHISEIIVTNYRINFYPFFRNDKYYFGELNVMNLAEEYKEGSQALRSSYVYDDGVIKGVVRVSGNEIEKLFVEPQFQSGGIGARLLEFAVNELHADRLWVLEYNTRGISFYRRNGFEFTGEKILEDDMVPLLRMERHK